MKCKFKSGVRKALNLQNRSRLQNKDFQTLYLTYNSIFYFILIKH